MKPSGSLIARSERLDDWSRTSHIMQKDAYGVFKIVVRAVDGVPAIPHNSKVKARSISSPQARVVL